MKIQQSILQLFRKHADTHSDPEASVYAVHTTTESALKGVGLVCTICLQ